MNRYGSVEILLFLFSLWLSLQKGVVARNFLMVVATVFICLIYKKSIFDVVRNIPKEIYFAY